jgi:hypothetical protein
VAAVEQQQPESGPVLEPQVLRRVLPRSTQEALRQGPHPEQY